MLSSQWVTAGVRPPHSATDNGNSYKDDGTEPQHSSRSSMKGDMRLLAALDPWTGGQCPTPVCNIHSCVRMEDRPPAECELPLRRDYPTDEAAMVLRWDFQAHDTSATRPPRIVGRLCMHNGMHVLSPSFLTIAMLLGSADNDCNSANRRIDRLRTPTS